MPFWAVFLYAREVLSLKSDMNVYGELKEIGKNGFDNEAVVVDVPLPEGGVS